MRFPAVLAALLFPALVAVPALVAANPDTDVQAPATTRSATPAAPSAASRFAEGQTLARQSDWAGAVAAYREATRLQPAFPEAWNGLGHALRKQGRFDESVTAYHEALRLRPAYPQALEYLGEAYVQLGRIAEARAVLERLRPLDPKEAAELEQAIAKAAKR
jgi:Flp pilus assembly protein TadD